MEFETWWLLAIPVFFGLGWIAARVDINQLVSESRSLPIGYFKGLNFLLNEQPDKAIDAFIEIVKLDPELQKLLNCILHLATCFGDAVKSSARFASIKTCWHGLTCRWKIKYMPNLSWARII